MTDQDACPQHYDIATVYTAHVRPWQPPNDAWKLLQARSETWDLAKEKRACAEDPPAAAGPAPSPARLRLCSYGAAGFRKSAEHRAELEDHDLRCLSSVTR